ncbi:MAG TPA: putative quinol monooxygenase [Rhizomicrobium sp.]|nr:putative quinol monooxygenase [Rhizomicrobium sp.]
MIVVTGIVTAKPETITELTQAAREHVHRSRGEPGCISHHVAVDADDPLTLHFIERWESADALKVHFAVPESRAFWRRLKELAADPGHMQVYETERIRI